MNNSVGFDYCIHKTVRGSTSRSLVRTSNPEHRQGNDVSGPITKIELLIELA